MISPKKTNKVRITDPFLKSLVNYKNKERKMNKIRKIMHEPNEFNKEIEAIKKQQHRNARAEDE